jgi:hypothetical protein
MFFICHGLKLLLSTYGTLILVSKWTNPSTFQIQDSSPQRVRPVADLKRANRRRKWSTIHKAALAPTKQAAFHNQPSRFIAWRLFVARNAT